MHVYKYSVHKYLLCMIKVSVVVVCGECYNLGLIDRFVVFVLSPPLYIVFKNTKNTRKELAHPVMGTIFLVIIVIMPFLLLSIYQQLKPPVAE